MSFKRKMSRNKINTGEVKRKNKRVFDLMRKMLIDAQQQKKNKKIKEENNVTTDKVEQTETEMVLESTENKNEEEIKDSGI